MPRLLAVLALAAVFSSPSRADVPGVSARPQLSLAIGAKEQVCAGVVAPQPWRDASDALFFATGPTARLDAHELWAGSLVPLAALRYAAGGLHLVVLGAPAQTQLRFTRLGWRPRWPFC
jgi:hypothetical protein